MNILLSIIVGVFLLGMVFLFTRIYCVARYINTADAGHAGMVTVWFGHPRIFSVEFDFVTYVTVIKIFGVLRFPFSKNRGEPVSPATGAAPQDSAQYSNNGEPAAGVAAQAPAKPLRDVNPPVYHSRQDESVTGAPHAAHLHIPVAETKQSKHESALPKPDTEKINQESSSADPIAAGVIPSIRSIWRRIKKSRLLFFVKQRVLRKKIFRWVKNILGALLGIVRVRQLRVTHTGSFGDFAVNGMVFGIVEALRYSRVIQERSVIQTEYIPVFDGTSSKTECVVSIYTSVWAAVRPVAVAFVRFPYLQFFVAWRQSRQYQFP